MKYPEEEQCGFLQGILTIAGMTIVGGIAVYVIRKWKELDQNGIDKDMEKALASEKEGDNL